VLDTNGATTGELAAEVFDKPERLAVLNGLVHPPVIRREEALIEDIRAKDPRAIAVMEAAILIETGSHTRFDKIVVAICRPEQQMERAMDRGLTREETLARLERQMPLEENDTPIMRSIQGHERGDEPAGVDSTKLRAWNNETASNLHSDAAGIASSGSRR
jgi:dephospho-CoA kinase